MHLENHLIQTFTGSPDLEGSTEQAWTALLEQYPAFNLGHYFLAKKQGQAGDQNATTGRRQAALHFNDIRWLDYLLKTKEIPSAQSSGAIAESEVAEEIPLLAGQPIEATPVETTEKASLIDSTDPTDQQQSTVSEEDITTPALETAAQKAAPEEVRLQAEDHPEENSRLSAVLSAQLADFKKPVQQDARLEVEREPLYKVDYFASQGISILKNQDGFDKKVRRFTDWLKEMKQQGTAPGSAAPQLNTTPQEEAQAAEKAAKSLENEPVWTESMAEVLMSQGKTEQARDVYKKLSLLYPEKSTYFASKIDLLQ